MGQGGGFFRSAGGKSQKAPGQRTDARQLVRGQGRSHWRTQVRVSGRGLRRGRHKEPKNGKSQQECQQEER
jgi:hypothetical protein